MSDLRVLTGADGKLGRLALQLSHAHYGADSIARAISTLQELETFENFKLISISGFPHISYALSRYCSIFNSRDPALNGVGSFDYKKIFADTAARNFHNTLKQFRDFEVSHLTERHVLQTVVYDPENRGSIILGKRLSEFSVEQFEPRSTLFQDFKSHLGRTQAWLKDKIGLLQMEIRKEIEASGFEHLPKMPMEDALSGTNFLLKAANEKFRNMMERDPRPGSKDLDAVSLIFSMLMHHQNVADLQKDLEQILEQLLKDN